MMMAEAPQGDDDIFVYMGGNQRVPDGVRRARIHKSVKIVRARAFCKRTQLISVEFHDGVEIIEGAAFFNCWRLSGAIKLLGVKIIKQKAFQYCCNLTGVEFGDKLETIEQEAFHGCISLKKIRIPSVRTIGKRVFANCLMLANVECGEGLRMIQRRAFYCCPKLERIALPLKAGMIEDDVFFFCEDLTTIDLVGGIHNTIASLHMESWRNEMTGEINRINQVLPTIEEKTDLMQQWMRSTNERFDHYKAEHRKLLKEATTLLELALWKTNLGENGGDRLDREELRTTKGSRKRARDEIRYTSGASIVIKNVLPFLALK